MMGYKARSLQDLYIKGLPTLDYSTTTSPDVAVEACKMYHNDYKGCWACRIDAPINTGKILPLFGSNKQTDLNTLLPIFEKILHDNPEYSFLCSEAPNDATRDANTVCWMQDDVMLGEISFESLTLRDAWTKGKPLIYYSIDGGVGDYLRNPPVVHHRVNYLRKIRNIIKHFHGEEFEISVAEKERIIVWQSISIKDVRDYTIFHTC